MILDSIDNGSLVYLTFEEGRRLDIRNTLNSLKHNNFKMIVMFKQKHHSHDLPPDVYALQGEDLTECINKAMVFLSAVASRFPPSNNQIRSSSNPRNQETIKNGRVTIQQVLGRQNQSYAGTGNRATATTSKENVIAGSPRGKLMLAKAQEANQILDKEQLVFLVDPDDLDAYDLDYDDLSLAKVILMANLSSCDPEVLSKVPYSDSYSNDMINQDVQEMQYSKKTHIDDFKDNEIHSGSNIIMYSQYLQESQDTVIQDTNTSAPNDLLVLSLVEQITDHVSHLDKEN
nr:hypothetical protein [Tanacetum cinerariifolium]